MVMIQKQDWKKRLYDAYVSSGQGDQSAAPETFVSFARSVDQVAD